MHHTIGINKYANDAKLISRVVVVVLVVVVVVVVVVVIAAKIMQNSLKLM